MTAPKLIVFDLDFTLWDCGGTWCDCLSPPFARVNGRVVDSDGSHVRLYNDVGTILDECDRAGVAIALASRTERPVWARELVELLGISERFEYAEIYPSSKIAHFEALREASGYDHSEMLFFDDEMRNIREVSELGVTSIHVTAGMTSDLFDAGLTEFRDHS